MHEGPIISIKFLVQCNIDNDEEYFLRMWTTIEKKMLHTFHSNACEFITISATKLPAKMKQNFNAKTNFVLLFTVDNLKAVMCRSVVL